MAEKSLVVVALPKNSDPTHTIGSEEKHATLLYFGDNVDRVAFEMVKASVLLSTRYSGEFKENVSKVATLGDENARVWLLDSDGLRGIRDRLLTVPALRALYDSIEQYPNYTPHVTIGYPPQGQDRLDGIVESLALTVDKIKFDRIAVWYGDDHDTIYRLRDDAELSDAVEAKHSDLVTDFLLHAQGDTGGKGDKALRAQLKQAEQRLTATQTRLADKFKQELILEFGPKIKTMRMEDLSDKQQKRFKALMFKQADALKKALMPIGNEINRLKDKLGLKHSDLDETLMHAAPDTIQDIYEQMSDKQPRKVFHSAIDDALDFLLHAQGDTGGGGGTKEALRKARLKLKETDSRLTKENVEELVQEFGPKIRAAIQNNRVDAFAATLEPKQRQKLKSITSRQYARYKQIVVPLQMEVIRLEKEAGVRHYDLDNFLAHYGVKGMKWGVRKDPIVGTGFAGAGKKGYIGTVGSGFRDRRAIKKIVLNSYENLGPDYTSDIIKIHTAAVKANGGESPVMGTPEVYAKYRKDSASAFETHLQKALPDGLKARVLTHPNDTRSNPMPSLVVVGNPVGLDIQVTSLKEAGFRHSENSESALVFELKWDTDDRGMFVPSSLIEVDPSEFEHAEDLVDDFLAHHGIKGMKWGVRRSDAQLARSRGGKKSENSDDTTNVETALSEFIKSNSTPPAVMSDDDIRSTIARANLLKQYDAVFNPGSASNAELRAHVEKLELEAKERQLKTSVTDAKINRVNNLVKTASTGFEAYSKLDKATGGSLSKKISESMFGKNSSLTKLDKLSTNNKLLAEENKALELGRKRIDLTAKLNQTRAEKGALAIGDSVSKAAGYSGAGKRRATGSHKG